MQKYTGVFFFKSEFFFFIVAKEKKKLIEHIFQYRVMLS